MNKKVEKIMSIVRDFLGNTNGLYIKHYEYYNDEVDGHLSYYYGDDQDIITHYDTNNPTFLDDMDFTYTYRTGASKLVIIPQYENYVIKIPFTHTYNVKADGTYEIFSEVNFDICEKEVQIYEDASDEAKEFLVPNEFVGFYNGIPIYIQKKIDYTYEDTPTIMRAAPICAATKIVRYLIDKCYIDYMFFNGLLVPYLHKFGITKFIRVVKELNRLDDIHSNNWGLYEENKIGIIDYGGYDGEELYNY